ncbi:TetR/AcrR family transcriptional regulator [Actinomadura terrae]|uniref:TetR/AcrR family transcriptional regulator n=1 Tax=Actinomadura terrae TaxID=604353 RepID=UPI001FA7030B|nr:TetR family transcriptional regulator [Actinomadura terrae]
MRTSASWGDQVSPNQAAKQRQIIEAAKQVLVRDGLAGCTVRSVADASPLTKSAVHYYFSDMDEIIDQAMADHISSFIERVRSAIARHTGPVDRLWAAVDEYVAIFQEVPRGLVLWHEYWIDSVRRGRLEPLERMFGNVTSIFTELLEDLGVRDASVVGHGLSSFLIGTVTQQAATERPVEGIRSQIAGLCKLDISISAS